VLGREAPTTNIIRNRRDLLLGGVAASTALLAGVHPSIAKSVRFGAAAMKENLQEDPLYREALIKYCDIIVPMNDLKWEALRPEQKTFAFEDADRALAFAKSNGKTSRGHALCWYEALPNWMKAINSPREAEAELRNHIETVVWNYRSRIQSWDVVNEAIAHDPSKQGIWRDGYWQKTLGERHIDIAFDAAAKTDPKAQLVYSDYDLENTGERETLRRKHTLDLVRRLKDKNIPVHGIGFQAHLYAERTIDEDGLARFARDLKAIDVAILVTELDVIDWRIPGSIAERDKAAAEHVSRFLSAISAEGPLDSIVTWGITDRYSWIPEHFKRRDGLANRPLPLDEQYKPKPMLDAIKNYVAKR
jgi:endo-1,4-beta-xylanase